MKVQLPNNKSRFIPKAEMFLIIVLLGSRVAVGQTLYQERFDLPDGTTTDTGNSAWSRDASVLWLGLADNFEVQDGYFEANDIDGEGIWTSSVINISGIAGGVDISVDVAEAGLMEDDDYLRLYYVVDGGSETLFADLTNDFGNEWQTRSTTGITGSTLQVVVRVNNDSDYETHGFDNVEVRYSAGGGALYSIASGDWDASGTWSTSSHSGVSCYCFPNEETDVYVGNSNAVNLGALANAQNVTINNTGVLQYTEDDVVLWIEDESTLQLNSGGTMDQNGVTGGIVAFTGADGVSQLVVNGGTFDVEGIYQVGSNTLEISGLGDITTSDLVLYTANSTLQNDLSGTFTVDNFYFYNANTTFINNAELSATALISYNADGSLLTNNTSGILTLSGDINLYDYNLTINNAGTINQAGNFLAIDGGSQFNNLDGGTWNWSYVGTDYDTSVDDILDCTNGTNTFHYSASGNQAIVSTTYSNLQLSGSGTKQTSETLNVTQHIYLGSGTTLNTTTDDINLSGNWVNSGGTFVGGSTGETLTLNGSGDQLISHATEETFLNLTINKAGGTVSSTGDIAVEGTLSLLVGNITLGDQNLTLGSGGSITGGSASSFVITDGEGQLIQEALGSSARTGDIFFPVGVSASSYTPLTINNSTGTSDNFGVKISSGVYLDGSDGTGESLVEEAVNRSWFITEEVIGGSDATLTFQWNTSEELSGLTRDDVTIIHYDGVEWEELTTDVASGTGPFTASVEHVNSFSPFGVRSTGATTLPVTLLAFTAKSQQAGVRLEWETSQEINNDFFTVEKSVDLKSFEEIATLPGHGTSSQSHKYHITDPRPYKGVSYYRLKQTDFDGKYSYSPVVSVSVQAVSISSSMTLFPVPNGGDYIQLKIPGLDPNVVVSIKVMDINGQVVHTEEGVFGTTSTPVKFSKPLEPGIYTLQAATSEQIAISKFVVY